MSVLLRLFSRKSLASGPWGLEGGLSGDTGVNLFNYSPVPSKCSLKARKGDKLTILTPGGGGWGSIS